MNPFNSTKVKSIKTISGFGGGKGKKLTGEGLVRKLTNYC